MLSVLQRETLLAEDVVQQKVIRPLLKGVCYLHELGIIHRDLKPENILVVDGRVVDGRVVDGRVVDGRVVDGRVVDGRPADSAANDRSIVGVRALVDSAVVVGPAVDKSADTNAATTGSSAAPRLAAPDSPSAAPSAAPLHDRAPDRRAAEGRSGGAAGGAAAAWPSIATVKITDFGLSAIAASTTRGALGTIAYASPETLRNKPYHRPVDLWSVGAICT